MGTTKKPLVKITVTENTVTLVKDKKIVAINKEEKPSLFEKVKKLSKTKLGIREIEKDFQTYFEMNSSGKVEEQEFTERAKDYTGLIKLKGTNNYLPTDVLKKFQELENKDQSSFIGLLKFWYKLDRNPSRNSREQLYRFIAKNNVPITEDGDIILEKGVKATTDGRLVDCHTGKMDNSIGRIVEMNRNEVEDNPNKTCSAGLHAAPPDYVRQHYSNNVIVKILVSPEDIVSVPVDYDSRKIRACKYQIIGYSDKTTAPMSGEKVISLESLLSDPAVLPKEEESKKQEILETVVKSTKKNFKIDTDFESMSAKQILEHIEKNYGVKIELNVKNKKGILKKAYEIASEKTVTDNYMKQEESQVDETIGKTIELPSTNQGIIDLAKEKFNESIGYREDGKKPNKEILIQRFTEIFENAGYTVIKGE